GFAVRGWLGSRSFALFEGQLFTIGIDHTPAALGEPAEQHFVGQPSRDLALDKPSQWTRSEAWIVAAFREPLPCRVRGFEGDLLLLEPILQFAQKFLNYLFDDRRAQRCEFDGGGEPIAEFA